MAYITNGEMRDTYKLLVWRERRKETTRKTIYRWVGYMKMDLGEMIFSVLVWLRGDHWRALVNRGMNFQVPNNCGKFLNGCLPDCLLRRPQLHRVSIIAFIK
jgi:hypothetical protein